MEENLARKLRGNLTQQELAKRMGVNQASVSQFERDKNPKVETLEKIAAAVGKRIVITIEDITEGNE